METMSISSKNGPEKSDVREFLKPPEIFPSQPENNTYDRKENCRENKTTALLFNDNAQTQFFPLPCDEEKDPLILIPVLNNDKKDKNITDKENVIYRKSFRKLSSQFWKETDPFALMCVLNKDMRIKARTR